MSQIKFDHEYWMYKALKLTKNAIDAGEIPVAAILVYKNKMISKGWNQSISLHDPTAHAEIITLRQGGLILKNYRLVGCVLYVTLEPCIMCFGAMLNSRIETLVYGAFDTKKNTLSLLKNIADSLKFGINHHIKVIGGILAPVCSEILNNFFITKRLKKYYNN